MKMNKGTEDITSVLKNFIEAIAEEKILMQFDQMKKQIIFENKPFLTLSDVCEITGLSKSTIYTYITDGKISYYKPTGKNLFFKWDDIRSFIMDDGYYFKSKGKLRIEAETEYMKLIR
jgi:excisionase family DNA binding protein